MAILLVASWSVPALAEGKEERDDGIRWLAPAPRTNDGRFTNPIGPLAHGTVGVRLPFFFRRIGAAFDTRPGAPVYEGSGGAFLRAPIDSPRVTWIGHATVLVEMDGIRFLTDPTWSETASPVSFAGPPRLAPPGVALEALPPIDFVVVSHNHFDHLDLATLVRLAERDPLTQFLVPLGNGKLLREAGISRVLELDWTETTRIGDVVVYCLPVQHWSKRSLFDDDRALWSSWAVIGPTRRFYYGGDTGYFTGFREIGAAHGPFDLAVLPIGAYAPREMMIESHMNPEEAWQAALDLEATVALGVHYGTFDLADEPSDEPPRRFRAKARLDEREADAWVLRIGEGRRF